MREKKLWRIAAEELISDNEKEELLESIHTKIETETYKKQQIRYIKRFIFSAASLLVIAVIVTVSIIVGLSDSDIPGDVFYSDKYTTQIELSSLDELNSHYSGNLNIQYFNPNKFCLNISNEDSSPVFFEIQYYSQNFLGAEDDLKLTVFLVENFEYRYEQSFNSPDLKNFDIEINAISMTINFDEIEMLNSPLTYTVYSKFKIGNYTYYLEGKYLKIPEITQIDNLVKYVIEQIF